MATGRFPKTNRAYDLTTHRGKVALRVYEATAIEGLQGIHFSKLVDDLNDLVSRKTISKELHVLLDDGWLSRDWVRIDGGTRYVWAIVYKVTPETQEDLSKFYAATHTQ